MVATCLAVPFLITEFSRDLEPYPAVLQPSGAYTISTTDSVLTFRQTQLVAREPDGSEMAVDTEAFMGAVPHHFWVRIADSRFGLEGTNKPSPVARQATLSWIQERLRAQGIDDANALVVRRVELSFDVKSGEETNRAVTEQINVDLS